MKQFLGYMLVVNIIAFLLYGIDKHKSRQKGIQRIPEKTLVGVAAIGGSIGALAGMYVFWHKIRKPKFYIGIPCLLLLQLVIFIVFYCMSDGIMM